MTACVIFDALPPHNTEAMKPYREKAFKVTFRLLERGDELSRFGTFYPDYAYSVCFQHFLLSSLTQYLFAETY
jgi:hypothetical protein